ncbi:MAG: CPBP family intramembrane metalloprotease, partial [Sphingobacteriales bacterium]|nr:CPBP family intramembrane metalloprotease [Sphingobacteriales bacterium]
MKDISKYCSVFFKQLNWPYYVCVSLLVALLIYLNYWHGLERLYLDTGSWPESFIKYFLLFFTAYAVSFFLQLLFYNNLQWHKQTWFWIIIIAGPLLFSVKVNFHISNDWISRQWEYPYTVVYKYSLNWIIKVFLIFLSLFFLWYNKDRKEQPFYGSKKTQSLKPYLLIIVFLFPLIVAASSQPDFLRMYPKAKNISEIPLTTLKDYGYYILFELSYGFDFLTIEFFFRGFLILSLIKICGKEAIIPMAAFYCTIHFGKPLGEAISSYFGGLLLGIVSYNTRSVWGGLIVHLGIAWLME